eukprot:gene468-657_t
MPMIDVFFLSLVTFTFLLLAAAGRGGAVTEPVSRQTILLAVHHELSAYMRFRSDPEYLYAAASIAGSGAVAWGIAAIPGIYFWAHIVAAFGVIAAGYLGSLLVAGSFLAVGAALSATTKNQVIAFVLAVAVCFIFADSAAPT